MQKLIIKGKKILSGVVEISGSKNATLPILAASILSNKKIEINNIPIVKDVMTMTELLKHIGSNIKIKDAFFENITKLIDTILVPGNHDANIEKLIPNQITLAGSKGIIIDDILLTHGHTMPTENFSQINTIVMGHIHPVIFEKESLINGERVWVSIICDKQKIFHSKSGELELIILPSFNKYFYATQKKFYKKSISPIIEKMDVMQAKILRLDGTIIGNEQLLSAVI